MKEVKKVFLVVSVVFAGIFGYAQSSYAPLNSDYYHLIDREQIREGTFASSFHSSFKPYSRKSIITFTDSLKSPDPFISEYLRQDNWEWTGMDAPESGKPVFRKFYRTPSDFYHVRTDNFDLHVNPVLHLSGGIETAEDETATINTRGVEIRGVVDGRVGFYSFLGENQAVLPSYVRNYVANNTVVPHEAFWKNFKSNGVDFFTPRGYITFQVTPSIGFQMGHDRFFIGNGIRSMILSDWAPAYLFMKFDTKVWRLQYTNLFTRMRADAFGASGGSVSGTRFPEKYMTLHHLSLNVTDNFNIGVFESVIFGREDSVGNNAFDLDYLNPIIFYRAIEQQNGSVDNVILGADFHWLLWNHLSLYGQVVLDEFLLDEFLSGDGWWGNKLGFQIGARYVDALGIENLDLQLEYNAARPYTYSHESIYTNYAHYRQPLAHPLGANFREVVGNAIYRPLDRLTVSGRIYLSTFGSDTTGTNFGGDILKDYTTRQGDFNNETTQGIRSELFLISAGVSYQLRHNLFIDLDQIYRDLDRASINSNENTSFTSLSIRWNIPRRRHEF